MAAYAALLSLANVIDQLEHHPRPPITLPKQLVEPLTENIAFLLEFLEIHNGGDGARGLETRIADAAYAAEDVIELHIVDQVLPDAASVAEDIIELHMLDEVLPDAASAAEDIIADASSEDEDIIESGMADLFLDGSTSPRSKISAADLYEGLQKVNEDMDSIKKEAKEFKHKPAHINSRPIASSTSARQQNTTMVGMDDALNKMMDMLVAGSSNRNLIPISGMGGIGKTTLALNLFRNETVVQHFHLLIWATISQEYTVKEILLQLLQQLIHDKELMEKLRHMNEYELAEKLYKELYGRRYLIILDDIWDIKIWEKMKLYFPDVKNGSRIVLTTRLTNLASMMSDSPGIAVGFLNEDHSWNLFCNTVFGKEDCPLELEKSGRKIVKSCRGLPLSINVIGGHVAMSAQTQQHWEYIAENVSSAVDLEGYEHCLEILYTSYNSLPLYLKPCFLYIGGFKEHSIIRASSLIRMWVAEGFLKPSVGKLLEEIAKECLTELAERNLISVMERNFYGKVKSFRIHDLLRDLCMREAKKEKFFYVPGVHCVDYSRERRIWSPNEETEMNREWGRVLGSLSVARTLIWKHDEPQLPRHGARFLRLYSTRYNPRRSTLMKHLLDVFKRVNLRYIDIQKSTAGDVNISKIPSSISLLWNLQTLVLISPVWYLGLSFEIWELPQLRHVKVHNVTIELPNHDYGFILENLLTLQAVQNLNLTEEIVKRIPNISKLGLLYYKIEEMKSHDLNLYYIGHLSKLNSLRISGKEQLFPEMQKLIFPNSLKKLNLYTTGLPWELMTTMVGSLPLLERLHLRGQACVGPKWITIKDKFRSLKLLMFSRCYDWKYWEMESSHFPRLEHVVLGGVGLKEIPSTLGDISTLESIRMSYCFRSAYDSAKRIQEEQEELENLDLQFHLPSKYELSDGEEVYEEELWDREDADKLSNRVEEDEEDEFSDGEEEDELSNWEKEDEEDEFADVEFHLGDGEFTLSTPRTCCSWRSWH